MQYAAQYFYRNKIVDVVLIALGSYAFIGAIKSNTFMITWYVNDSAKSLWSGAQSVLTEVLI